MSYWVRIPELNRCSYRMKLISLLLVATGMFALPSCEKAVEGCRDLRATNFNARAELDCSDCCNYPDLRISIGYRVFDSLLSTAKYYPLLNGDSISILEQGFFLSDFILTTPSGEYRAGQTLTARSRTGSLLTFRDDHLLSQISSSQRSLDFWLGPEYDEVPVSLSFNLGLTAPKSEVNALLMTGGNPLNQTQGNVWYDSLAGYTHQRWTLKRWPQKDTLRLAQIGGSSTITINLPWPANKRIYPGETLDVVLKVDLGTWIQGVDFKVNDPASLLKLLKEAAPQAFAIQ